MKSQIEGEEKSPLARLGCAGDDTIINMKGLAEIFGRSTDTIKRAIKAGELPQPVKFLGGPAWTVKSIIRHLEERLAQEAEAANGSGKPQG